MQITEWWTQRLPASPCVLCWCDGVPAGQTVMTFHKTKLNIAASQNKEISHTHNTSHKTSPEDDRYNIKVTSDLYSIMLSWQHSKYSAWMNFCDVMNAWIQWAAAGGGRAGGAIKQEVMSSTAHTGRQQRNWTRDKPWSGADPEPEQNRNPRSVQRGSIRTSGWVLLNFNPSGQMWGFTLSCFLLHISCRSLNTSWWWSACELFSLCPSVCLWWHRYVRVKGHWSSSLSLDSQPKSWWVICHFTGSLVNIMKEQ